MGEECKLGAAGHITYMKVMDQAKDRERGFLISHRGTELFCSNPELYPTSVIEVIQTDYACMVAKARSVSQIASNRRLGHGWVGYVMSLLISEERGTALPLWLSGPPRFALTQTFVFSYTRAG